MIRFRPIDVWPGAETARRLPPPFTAGWAETVNLLRREVRALAPFGLDTPDTVIQLDIAEHAIRQDGGLRQGSRVESPRVVVSFDSIHGPLRYSCDRFDSPRSSSSAWQHNVRAIALGLEALRKVDRYGIGRGGEQYRGWTAISAAPDDGPLSVGAASALLAREAGITVEQGDVIDGRWVRLVYRLAVKHHHPDTGGDPARFRRLTEARDILIGALP